MRALNRWEGLGRLGKDPEIKFLPSGVCVCEFSMACDYEYMKEGVKIIETNWIPVIAFGKLAEVMGEYLHKGKQVYIEGRFKTDQWEDKDGGQRYFSKIHVSNWIMTGSSADTAPPQTKPIGTTTPKTSRFRNNDFDDDIPF